MNSNGRKLCHLVVVGPILLIINIGDLPVQVGRVRVLVALSCFVLRVAAGKYMHNYKYYRRTDGQLQVSAEQERPP